MDVFRENKNVNGVLHNWNTRNDIEALIHQLGSSNGLIRQQAGTALIKKGEAAVDALIDTLKNGNELTRLEAAKALSQIDSPRTAQALVQALEDDMFSVRWLAAEELIALGRDGLEPLLRALWQAPDSIRLHDSAHHILHNLVENSSLDSQLSAKLEPILSTLNYLNPTVALQTALIPAIKMLEKPNN